MCDDLVKRFPSPYARMQYKAAMYDKLIRLTAAKDAVCKAAEDLAERLNIEEVALEMIDDNDYCIGDYGEELNNALAALEKVRDE